MQFLDQQTQQQIADLVDACAGYWELRGVAQASRDDMQLELEHHLQQAACDGKPLEAVLGPHPVAFAEAWAREMHPRICQGVGSILPGLVYALSVVSTTALVSQLLAHTPLFTFTLFAAYLLLGSGLLALLLQLGGFLSPHIRTRARRATLLLAGIVLIVLMLRAAGIRVNWSMELLSWNWPMSVFLLILAVGLFSLHCWRFSQKDDPFSARSVLAQRSIPVFVVSVAAFDGMLFVASVMVFNVCILTLWLR